jgi:hypothetical protein
MTAAAVAPAVDSTLCIHRCRDNRHQTADRHERYCLHCAACTSALLPLLLLLLLVLSLLQIMRVHAERTGSLLHTSLR